MKQTTRVLVLTEDYHVVLGINNRLDIKEGRKILNQRKIICLPSEKGVPIPWRETETIETRGNTGRDTIVFPLCNIIGRTAIGKNCQMGSSAYLKDTRVKDKARIWIDKQIGRKRE